MQRPTHVANLIEKNSAAIRFLDPTGLGAQRTCECAFLVAEQFAFQEVFRNGRAVETNIIFIGARTEMMDGASHQLLARAALAENQHGGISRRHSLDKLAQVDHLGRVTHDLV